MPTFDPSFGADDEFIDQQNTELYNSLLAELKNRTTGRWDYGKIDYCWTDKDADLDTYGYQGLHVDFIDDTKVTATVHCGKTVGSDERTSDDTRREQNNELLYEIVCGCGYSGDWSGDDWFLTNEVGIEVATVLNPETGELDAQATAEALYDAAQEALKDWDSEMESLSQCVEDAWKEIDLYNKAYDPEPMCQRWTRNAKGDVQKIYGWSTEVEPGIIIPTESVADWEENSRIDALRGGFWGDEPESEEVE